jgi:FKBP-type peptidyl-prolyl cis-trans isomerase
MYKSIIQLGSVFLLTSFLFSCNEYKTTDKGLKYKILADSAGNNCEEGGEALIHFQIKNHNDSIIQSTFTQNSPIPVQIKKEIKDGGLISGLTLLSQGDSALFVISSDSIFPADAQLPPGVFRGKDLSFTVKVLKTINKAESEAQRVKFEKEFEERKKILTQQLASDTATIVKYLKDKKIKYSKNPGGVYYTITKAGKGPKLGKGDSMAVNYVGKFLDGKQFDAGNDFPFVLGESQVISGWHMAIGELSWGDKATVFIPSPYGYGIQGAGANIPPNTILVFDLEIPEKK